MIGDSDTPDTVHRWKMAAAHVPGSGHLEHDIPCQDRAGTCLVPRPCLIALDGRGSAARSHLGAAASLAALQRTLELLEDELSSALDADSRGIAAIRWQGLACRLYVRAAEEQRKLADWYETVPSEFEHTLALCIAGRRHFGWMTVGDSPLVIVRHGIAGMVQHPQPAQFANQTDFVTASPGLRPGIQGGLVPSAGIQGVLAMSDGAASRLMSLRDHVPASAVVEIMERVGSGAWDDEDLRCMLRDSAWDLATRDDRCIALLGGARRPTKVPGICRQTAGAIPPV